jgi:hypothetical protein
MLEAMWNDALARLKLAAELEAARRGPRPRRRQKQAARNPPRSADRKGSK